MDFFNLKFDNSTSSIKSDLDEFKVYAHENESLMDHINKTSLIFNSIIDEDVLFNFYNKFLENNLINLSFDMFKSIIVDSINYHDIGKISYNFQINRLNKDNPVIRSEQNTFLKDNNFDNFLNDLTPLHSFTSSIVFLLKYKEILEENEFLLLILAYVINGHHTKLTDISSERFFSYGLKNKEIIINTFQLIGLYTNNLTLDEINDGKFQLSFFNRLQNKLSNFLKNEFNNESFLSFFYMYIYSALISADVFSSNKYDKSISEIFIEMNDGISWDDSDITKILEDKKDQLKSRNSKFNHRIDDELKNIMNNTFDNVSYNKNLETFNFPNNFEDIRDINDLRKSMLVESSNTLKEHIDSQHIFFLNMPTGGGKTNTSMKLALDIINKNKVNRIIYAMPFINIIEQNYDIIRDNFGLSEEKEEIRQIYSGSETLFSNFDNESKYDVILNDDFFNYPVICTTFVSLFNSIIKSNKKYKYKLASLANSVIILDEIQSLPLNNWSSLYYIINELAKNYNVYFIIMSATLPNFNQLKLESSSNLEYSNISLIENSEKYFDHILFNRTQIQNEIVSFTLNKDDSEDFKNYILNILEINFNQNYTKGLLVFNTINTSKLVFDILSEYSSDFDFEIDLLNSSMMPSTKQEIISKINNMGENDKKYILISTQSIEAGVDVSFDFVVRDFAIIDSIEQVRGRCNRSRELNKKFNDSNKKGNIYLVKLDNGDSDKAPKCFFEYIYNQDEKDTRIKSTELLFENSLDYSYSDICGYYDNVSCLINDLNDDRNENLVANDRDNIKFFNGAEFSRLLDPERGIHIINNDREQFSIFISEDLDVMTSFVEEQFLNEFDENIFDLDLENNSDFIRFYEEYKKGFIFSINELKFIKEKQLYENNKILSDHLLDYYNSVYNNKRDMGNQNHYKIIQKEFSSILYKFIINISVNSYNYNLQSKIETLNQLGFFYILPKNKIGDGEADLYSIKRGFNFDVVEDVIL